MPMNLHYGESAYGLRTPCVKQIASVSRCCWLILFLFVYGCAQTTTAVKHPTSVKRDGAPDKPMDVTRIPDAVPRAEPRGKRGNASSYVVWGKRYKVMKKSKDFVQRGVASWYGKKFHGRKTSNGEVYDMYAMTAAHKSLPLPSYLEVTNLRNHKSVIVRVNDRGPFHKDRIIDLSYSAAKKLGIVRTGTGYVEIRDVSPIERNTRQVNQAHPAPIPQLYVQVGAFSNRENADRLVHTIEHPRLPGSRIKSENRSSTPLYRVQIGPVATIGEAHRVIDQLQELGITSTRLITEPSTRHGTQLQ